MRTSGFGARGIEGRDDQHSSRTRPFHRSSGSADGEDGHRASEFRSGPGRRRVMIEAARAHPGGEWAPRAPGPGGDVAPVAIRPTHREVVLTLRVPFESPLEASLSLRGMVPDAQRLQGIIRKDFAVYGSDLIVWIAEDLASIQIAINSFLHELSLVIQNIRSLGIPPFLG